MTAQEWLSWYPNPLPELIARLDAIKLPEWPDVVLETDLSAELNHWLCQWLSACFSELGLLEVSHAHASRSGWPEYFSRWQAESLRQLVASGLAVKTGEHYQLTGSIVNRASLIQQWHDAGFRARCPDVFHAQMQLLEACVWALPDILTGQRKATDVLFPNSSMALVEGIYKGNPLADAYNQIVQDNVLAYLHQRLALEPNAQFRVLEIGAGTGGTSAGLFKRLKPLQNHIAEYCYTDLSKAFLNHAENQYAGDAPYLRTALFDVSKAPSVQGLANNTYDMVIAANVLHATPSIKPTLRHAKQLLRNRGVLVLNEISANSLMAHLTFGLLAGWWLYQDEHLRIPGSPGLSPDTWQDVLLNEGFNHVLFPAPDWHGLGQQIILAQSDGRVRLTQASAPTKPVLTPAPTIVKANPTVSAVSELSPRAALLAWLSQAVAACLKMPVEKIHAGKALESYGLDSILVVQLTNQLHKHFNGVTSTLFFEVATLNA
ncbi:methyltransferase [Methylocucumis oryzae]|uniref:methyltransferase n=1 Tax=Methylocucumis oryzae TaxID=1632867 RepID=UPI000AC02A10|nr:methyltransferase [Methylocucumis oryzae]